MSDAAMLPLAGYREIPLDEMIARARRFREEMSRRPEPTSNPGTSSPSRIGPSSAKSALRPRLTHTPSPMKFLNRILARPPQERPFLLLVTGYPAPGASVPDIHRKPLAEIASFREHGAAGRSTNNEN